MLIDVLICMFLLLLTKDFNFLLNCFHNCGQYMAHVVTGNYILSERVPKLKSRIDHVNTLDKDGLKHLLKAKGLYDLINLLDLHGDDLDLVHKVLDIIDKMLNAEC